MKIERPSPDRILLSQGSNVCEIATSHLGGHTADYLTSPGKYSPLAKGANSAPAEDEASKPFTNTKRYQQIVGELNWVACGTRPDISYAVSWLSRHLKAPTEHHYCSALRVVRYLAGTADYALSLAGSGEPIIKAYSDADLGADPDTGRSTTGIVICLGESPIAWHSARQKSVARSTTEAEYMAASEASREIVVTRVTLEDLGFVQTKGTRLYVDNQSAIKLTKTSTSRFKTAHIARHYHYICEQVELGAINVEYVPSAQQIADVMTKALAGPAHKMALQQLHVLAPFSTLF